MVYKGLRDGFATLPFGRTSSSDNKPISRSEKTASHAGLGSPSAKLDQTSRLSDDDDEAGSEMTTATPHTSRKKRVRDSGEEKNLGHSTESSSEDTADKMPINNTEINTVTDGSKKQQSRQNVNRSFIKVRYKKTVKVLCNIKEAAAMSATESSPASQTRTTTTEEQTITTASIVNQTVTDYIPTMPVVPAAASVPRVQHEVEETQRDKRELPLGDRCQRDCSSKESTLRNCPPLVRNNVSNNKLTLRELLSQHFERQAATETEPAANSEIATENSINTLYNKTQQCSSYTTNQTEPAANSEIATENSLNTLYYKTQQSSSSTTNQVICLQQTRRKTDFSRTQQQSTQETTTCCSRRKGSKADIEKVTGEGLNWLDCSLLSTRNRLQEQRTPDQMRAQICHTEQTWNLALRSTELKPDFVHAAVAFHLGHTELMTRDLLWSHALTLANLFQNHALQQPGTVDFTNVVNSLFSILLNQKFIIHPKCQVC
jgi:hypothetical protein